ncbi:Hypothetical protein D9617_17g046580 [Elsinoe fawcettii]|nr:Hypothetical protein D9617_17g046580 [Elsinoe fawcettii]
MSDKRPLLEDDDGGPDRHKTPRRAEAADATTAFHTANYHNHEKVNTQIGSQINHGMVSFSNIIGLQDHSALGVQQLLQQQFQAQQAAQAKAESEALQKARDQKRERVLTSLYFPMMNYRKDKLEDAHRSTFQWVMRDELPELDDVQSRRMLNKCPTWDSFPGWLRDTACTTPYWIQGKPGSGKSMLMRFLELHEDVPGLLHSGRTIAENRVVSFYFWLSGTQSLLKAIEGALRSLLHQIIASSNSAVDHLSIPVSSFDWTERLLLSNMRSVLAHSDSRWLVMLDGLDETSDKIEDVLTFIAKLWNLPNVCLLISSRPWRPFEVEFRTYPSLRLQDLTFRDINKYIEDKLGAISDISSYLSPEQLGCITRGLSSQSSGVFLWVKLALNSVRDGLECHETLTELLDHLQCLPSDVDEMFSVMLTRLRPNDLERCYFFFELLLGTIKVGQRLTTLETSTAEILFLKGHLPGYLGLESSAIRKNAERVESFLRARCGDFLETYKQGSMSIVGFTHRTAADFMTNYILNRSGGVSYADIVKRLSAVQAHHIRQACEGHKVNTDLIETCYRWWHYLSWSISLCGDESSSIWQELNDAGRHMMNTFNKMTDKAIAQIHWPGILSGLQQLSCGYPDTDHFSHLRRLPRLIRIVASQGNWGGYMIDRRSYCARVLASDLFDPSWLRTPRAATSLALRCLFFFPNLLISRDGIESPGTYPSYGTSGALLNALYRCFAAGARTDISINDSLPLVSLCSETRLLYEKPVSRTLRDALVRELNHIKFHASYCSENAMEEIVGIIKLFDSNGGINLESKTQMRIEATQSTKSGLTLKCNLTTYFCHMASYNPAWTDLARYFWEKHPCISVQYDGTLFKPIEVSNQSATYGLTLVESQSTQELLYSAEAAANLDSRDNCPFIPTTEQVKQYEVAVRAFDLFWEEEIEEILANIGQNPITWEDLPEGWQEMSAVEFHRKGNTWRIRRNFNSTLSLLKAAIDDPDDDEEEAQGYKRWVPDP